MVHLDRDARCRVGLALLVALALALRLIGLGHQLPQHPEEDALIVSQAEHLRSVWAGEPPVRALDPHYPLVLASALALWPPTPHDAERERDDPLAWHLARASEGHRRARALVAWIATLAVPVAWLLARRFVGEAWALFAAAMTAFSLLHLQYSQAARPHGALATWIALGLWLDLRLLERGRWRDHLGAALAAALALGTLHTGASALLPLGAAQAIRLRRDGAAALPRVLASLALVAVLGLLAYGWPFHTRGSELAQAQGQVLLSGHVIPAASFDGGGFARMLPLLWQTDPLLLLCAALGLASALASWVLGRRRPGGDAWLLASWAVPFLVVLGVYSRLPSRFLLPLVPLLAVLASIGLARGRLGPRAAAALACALLALPAWAGARLAWLRARPEVAQVVAAWIEANAQRERDLLYVDIVAQPPLFLRNEDGAPHFSARMFVWDRYQAALAPAVLDEHGWRMRRLIARDPVTGNVSMRSDVLQDVLREPPRGPVQRRFAVVAFEASLIGTNQAAEAVLAQGGRVRLAVPAFHGDLGDPQRGPLDVRDRDTLATLLATRRLGWSTVVYELPPWEDPGTDDQR